MSKVSFAGNEAGAKKPAPTAVYGPDEPAAVEAPKAPAEGAKKPRTPAQAAANAAASAEAAATGARRAAAVKAAKEAAEAGKGLVAAAAAIPEAHPKKSNAGEKAKRLAEALASLEENAASVSSTDANIGLNKPHLRTKNFEGFDDESDSGHSNSDSVSSVPEAERNNNRNLADFEPNAPDAGAGAAPPDPITPKADTTMFLLLRIGIDTASEYIELRKQPIASMGAFNTHTLGSVKEFESLYGVQTPEEYKAMQRVFGVPSYGRLPTFAHYMERKCKFLGFDLVKQALQRRISTLNESITIANNSMNKNRNKHFLEYLRKVVADMGTFTRECGPEDEPQGPKPKSSGPSFLNRFKGQGCPCLEELSLLRDLVYIVVTIEGTARPEVKTALEKIPLDKLLNKAAKVDDIKPIIQQIIDALKTIGTVTTSADAGTGTEISDSDIQPVLKEIWLVLTKTAATKELTKQDIIEEIQKLLAKVKECDAAGANVARLQAELDDVTKRYMALQEVLGKVDRETNAGAIHPEEYKKLEARVADLDGQLKAKTAEVDALKASSGSAASEKAAQDAYIAQLRREITALTADRNTAQAELAAAQNELGPLRGRIAELEADLAAARAAAQAAEGEKTAKEAERAGLQARIEELEAEAAKGVTGGKALTDELAQVRKDLAACREQLAAHEEASRTAEAAATAAAAALADAQAEIGRLGGAEAAAAGSQVELGRLQAEKAELEATLAAAQADYARQLGEIQQALTGSEGEAAGLKAQLAALQEELPELREKAARTNRAEATARDLEARIAELTRQIEGLQAGQTTSAEEHTAAMADLNAQLAAARAALAEKEGVEGQRNTATRDLQGARARITALEAELAAKSAAGTNATAAFDRAKGALEAELVGLREQLAAAQAATGTAQQEKEAVATAAKQAAETLKAQTEQELTRLRGELAAAQANSRQKNSNRAANKAEWDKQIAELQAKVAAAEDAKVKAEAASTAATAAAAAETQGLKAQLATSKKTAENAAANASRKAARIAELERQVAEVSAASAAKNANIAGLRGQLDEAQRSSAEALGGKEAELGAARTALSAADEALGAARNEIGRLGERVGLLSAEKEIALGAGRKAVENLAEEKNQEIAALQAEVDKLGPMIEEAVKTDRAQTKERLNTLLAMIAINDEIKDKAMEWWEGEGNEEELERLKGSLDGEICAFFMYLAGLVNLQTRKIASTALSAESKDNIFTIFRGPIVEHDEVALRKELGALFQELFVQIGKTSEIPKETPIGKYHELFKILSGFDISAGKPLKPAGVEALKRELGTFGYLSTTGAIPKEGDAISVRHEKNPTEFDSNNTENYVPLVVLGIKFIQLLAKSLNEKYKVMRERCKGKITI